MEKSALEFSSSKLASRISEWYGRKFAFAFPVELYPDICMRLRGTPARLDEIVKDRPRKVLVRKPAGKWSAQEHVGHLLDLEPLWSERVRNFVDGGDQLATTDLSNRKTDEANHNSTPIDQILAEFRNSRLRLLEQVQNLPPETLTCVLVHPRLQQELRLVDHLYFVAEHDDHHLARIWELVAEPG